MAKLTITIKTDNAAFYDEYSGDIYRPVPEVTRILRELADDMEAKESVRGSFPLLDANGKRVGDCTYEQD